MAEPCSPISCYVKFPMVIGLVHGWFVTEWTFFHDEMRGGFPKEEIFSVEEFHDVSYFDLVVFGDKRRAAGRGGRRGVGGRKRGVEGGQGGEEGRTTGFVPALLGLG
jgi:hypothetical protein